VVIDNVGQILLALNDFALFIMKALYWGITGSRQTLNMGASPAESRIEPPCHVAKYTV